VTADYFDAVSLTIAQGRALQSRDAWYGPHAETNAPLVVVINEAMAERHFAGKTAVGRKLVFPGMGNASAEIVGVVANARTEALTRSAGPEIYFSLWQLGPYTKHLVVRSLIKPGALIAPIRDELRAIDPTVAIERVRTLDQVRADSIGPQTFAMRLLAAFSLVGSALALVGIYGVLLLSVRSRSREMVIRVAIGAQRRDIVGLVLREGFRLIAVGLTLGIVLAIALARVLGTFLFEVEPTDPATFLGVALLFTMAALLACWAPAHRAARMDPMEVLRHE
jgi:putative ABC transport system permease protein